MDEIKRALLGDKEAQRAVTERGELLPCYRCGGTRIALKHNGWYYYEWTIVNKKDTIFKYIFWERLDSLPIPECCFHFIWC